VIPFRAGTRTGQLNHLLSLSIPFLADLEKSVSGFTRPQYPVLRLYKNTINKFMDKNTFFLQNQAKQGPSRSCLRSAA
jgi:hypothetical protein